MNKYSTNVDNDKDPKIASKRLKVIVTLILLNPNNNESGF